MSTKLVSACLATWIAASASADVVTFQQGVNGYAGTHDTEFAARFLTQPLGDLLSMSIDENDGGFPNQGAIRFDNIFVDQGGLVPRDQEILFAELEFFPTSSTDADAIISFNRILGPDQNRRSGTGIWQETDSWNSLGGDDEAEGDPPLLNEKPIELGPSTTLGPGNEAVAAPESFDANGNPRGILPRQFNSLSTGNFVTIDVTDSLLAWQAGAPNVGWAINNTTGNGWDFLTSEWAVALLPAEDQQETQALLDFFGLTEEQVRPLLRVAFGIAGDLDLDGDVDEDDYALLRGALGNSYDARGELGDLDFDRDADLEDFNRFKIAFDEANGVGAFSALILGVPEPGSMLLTLLAASSFMVRRRPSA